MRKVLTLAAAAALAWGQLGAAQAMDLSVAIGQTGDSTMTYRLGAQFDFKRSWFASDVGRLTGYWDAGYTYWEGDLTASNHSVSFSPVFVYEFAGERFKPYIEAGIGVAALAALNWKITTWPLHSNLKTVSAWACASPARKSVFVRCTTPMRASNSRTKALKATPCITERCSDVRAD